MDTHISPHETAIYSACLANRRWLTNKEIATLSGVAYRTARHHTSRLVKAGVLEQARLFPGFRFRLSAEPTQVGQDHINRLVAAAAIFGS